MCVGDAFGASGAVVNSTYISHSAVTCGSAYNTELAKTNVSSAYGGANYNEDYQTFADKYCGGTPNVSGSPVCYKVFHKNQNAYKMVVIADCINAGGSNEYVEFMNSDFVIKYGTTNTQTSSGVGWRATFKAKCGVVTCASGQSPGTWGAANSYGIQTAAVYNNTRDCNLCKQTQVGTTRRCAANWYGTPSSDTSGCTKCVAASITHITGTSPAGSTTQSQCTYKCAAGYYGTATSNPTSCVSCPSGATTSSAGATTVSSCRCKSGYYGTASAGKACTACPAYATCAGGNGSTFVCASGFVGNWDTSKSFVGCFMCPTNATCTEDNYTCAAGYYADYAVGTSTTYSCTACPKSSMDIKTDGTPISGIPVNEPGVSQYSPQANHSMYGETSCYLPAGTVYGFNDTGGIYVFGTNCYYDPDEDE